MMSNINLSFWMMIGWLQENMMLVIVVAGLAVLAYGALLM